MLYIIIADNITVPAVVCLMVMVVCTIFVIITIIVIMKVRAICRRWNHAQAEGMVLCCMCLIVGHLNDSKNCLTSHNQCYEGEGGLANQHEEGGNQHDEENQHEEGGEGGNQHEEGGGENQREEGGEGGNQHEERRNQHEEGGNQHEEGGNQLEEGEEHNEQREESGFNYTEEGDGENIKVNEEREGEDQQNTGRRGDQPNVQGEGGNRHNELVEWSSPKLELTCNQSSFSEMTNVIQQNSGERTLEQYLFSVQVIISLGISRSHVNSPII